jgi:hypothetical protein
LHYFLSLDRGGEHTVPETESIRYLFIYSSICRSALRRTRLHCARINQIAVSTLFTNRDMHANYCLAGAHRFGESKLKVVDQSSLRQI